MLRTQINSLQSSVSNPQSHPWADMWEVAWTAGPFEGNSYHWVDKSHQLVSTAQVPRTTNDQSAAIIVVACSSRCVERWVTLVLCLLSCWPRSGNCVWFCVIFIAFWGDVTVDKDVMQYWVINISQSYTGEWLLTLCVCVCVRMCVYVYVFPPTWNEQFCL